MRTGPIMRSCLLTDKTGSRSSIVVCSDGCSEVVLRALVLTPLPADPALICAYLTEPAAAGLSVSSVDLAWGAISYRHRRHGLDDPVRTEDVRQVRRGLRCLIGASSVPRPGPGGFPAG